MEIRTEYQNNDGDVVIITQDFYQVRRDTGFFTCAWEEVVAARIAGPLPRADLLTLKKWAEERENLDPPHPLLKGFKVNHTTIT